MPVNKKQNVFTTAGAERAKKLGMRRKNDMTTLRFGQEVLLVTENGMTYGTICTTHGREDTHRYDLYILEHTTLCSYTFNRLPGSSDDAPVFEETPIVEIGLPEGAVLYAAPAPKEPRKSTRKTGARY